MSKRTSTDDEKIGPGCPPRNSQFQPGQSGNPGGRPKKERDLGKLVNRVLDETVTVTENGERMKVTKRELIARSMVNDAARGNLRAVEALVRLVGASNDDQDRMVAVDPAQLASFIARHAARDNEPQGGDQ